MYHRNHQSNSGKTNRREIPHPNRSRQPSMPAGMELARHVACEPLEGRVLLSAVSYELTDLASLSSSNANPYGNLAMDAAGNLYGTTYTGGSSNLGTVYKIASGSSVVTTIASFTGANGAFPYAGLTLDANGNLYGTTDRGGAHNWGSVFEIVHGTTIITTLASFDYANGGEPHAALIRDPQGNLFGTTFDGGASTKGNVFKVAATTNTLTTLATFTGQNGSSPWAGVTRAANGDLFGTTFYGGSNNKGLVYKIASGSNTITPIASFNGTNGAYPVGGVTLDSAGNIYGTAEEGGAFNAGVVFTILSGGNVINTIASFNGANGKNASSSLKLDSNGNLFGVTENGGSSDNGTVFEVVSGTNTITTLAQFNGANGQFPIGGLTLDAAGNLYGTTNAGGTTNHGVVYKLSPVPAADAGGPYYIPSAPRTLDASKSTGATPLFYAWDLNGDGVFTDVFGDKPVINAQTFRDLGVADGSHTISLQITDSNGHVATAAATVILDSAVTNGYTLASLSGFTDGAHPTSNLVRDSAGNFYGTTYDGGENNLGTVFKLASGSNVLTTIASFNGTNGSEPRAGLTFDSNGNLFGTTSGGGAFGFGTVFEIAKGANTLSTIASFNGTNGSSPIGGITFDSKGTIYGAADAGGANDRGTVFKIVAGSNVITTIASFNLTNGWGPESGVIIDANGNLYGTTILGGANDYGTVFKIAAGTNVITPITFDGSNGANPEAGLTLDAKGNIYGTTTSGGGGNGYGTVFKIASGTNVISTVAIFNITNGAMPTGAVILDAAGNIYGTTYGGGTGTSGGGTVFKIASGSNVITTLANFDGAIGANPRASLLLDAAGNLYGTTQYGGDSERGSIFKVSPVAVANAGGPYVIGAGAAVTLDASKSTGPAPLAYSWDLNNDGVFGDATGAKPALTAAKLASFGLVGGVVARSYTVALKVTDANGHTSLATSKLTINPILVTGYVLVNADTDKDIMQITEGMTLDLSKLPRRLNIRATTVGAVNSITFTFDGKARLEAQVPWAVFGDWNGDYVPGALAAGTHTLMAKPFTNTSGTGVAGPIKTVNFKVINQAPVATSTVTAIILYNTATDQNIKTLQDGNTLDLSLLPSTLGIRGSTTGVVGSVQYVVDTRIGVPATNALTVGSHSITAIPFSGPNATGTPGASKQLHLNVIRTVKAAELRMPLFHRLIVPDLDVVEAVFPDTAEFDR